MVDDKSGDENRQQIDVRNYGDLREWATKLEVSEEEIKFAIRAVGPAVDDVRGFLARY